MVMEIFLLELVLVGCFIIIRHRACMSSEQEKRMLQSWLDKVTSDAEQHRERSGKNRLRMIDINKRGAIE